MSAQHILYSFRRCPYAMRARMGLKIADIDYEHREVLLRDKPTEMLQVSPKATVPIIVRSDGKVIDESFDIMLWALGHSDPEDWLAPDMGAMLGLIKTIEGPFAQHQFRYKYASFFDDSLKRGDVNIEHRDAACVILADYENILAASPYLMGDAPSLADYAIFPFIRQFAAVEKKWWDKPQFPHLHKWLAYFLEVEIFTSVMEKYPLFESQVPTA
ncbi:MAG: glutathione S-transferase [Robiginitomaculum sp.]|nr:glutathione S-transferase [Robiginitomaculum sp.]